MVDELPDWLPALDVVITTCESKLLDVVLTSVEPAADAVDWIGSLELVVVCVVECVVGLEEELVVI